MNTIISFTAFILFICFAVSCRGKANVTLQLGLTYVGGDQCDFTPYKVNVCVGERLKTCRLFGPHDFFVQASCASYGQQDVIEFVVDNVKELLQIDSSVKLTNSEKSWKLKTIRANLTESRELPATSDDLLYIVRYRVSYNCVANYFGEFCDIYCSPEAKEYSCGPTGNTICNPEYVKDESTGACIRDQCRLMPDYCRNDGRCVNKAQDADTTAPTCICDKMYRGPRCEQFEYNRHLTTSPLVLVASLREKHARNDPIAVISSDNIQGGVKETRALSEKVDLPANQNVGSANTGELTDKTDEENELTQGTNHLPPQPQPPQMISESSVLSTDRSLWYQIVIFTVVAICLTIFAFGACIGAGCYLARLKAKADLIRHQQEHIIDDIRYVDSTNMPVYLKRCSTLDYSGANNLNHNPSVQSFSMNQRPYTTVSPLPTVRPEHQGLVFSDDPSRSPEPGVWPPPLGGFTGTLHRYGQQWDFPMPNFSSLRRSADNSVEMCMPGADSVLLPKISPEAYSCQCPTTYGYLSAELNNQLKDDNLQLGNGEDPPLNNSLSLRPVPHRPVAVFEDKLTKNNFLDHCDMSRFSNDQSPLRTVVPLPYATPNQFVERASN